MVLAAVWVWSVPSLPGAQTMFADEERLADFLVAFLRYVEWPPWAFAGDRAPVVVCVDHADPIAFALTRRGRGSSLGSRSLEVRRRPRAGALSDCQVALVRGAAGRDEVDRVVEYARRTGGLLTVGQVERFTARGGMVEVAVDPDRIRFIVNLASAESAGLRISAKALALGRVVRQPAW